MLSPVMLHPFSPLRVPTGDHFGQGVALSPHPEDAGSSAVVATAAGANYGLAGQGSLLVHRVQGRRVTVSRRLIAYS